MHGMLRSQDHGAMQGSGCFVPRPILTGEPSHTVSSLLAFASDLPPGKQVLQPRRRTCIC